MENLTPEKWGNTIIGGQTPEMIADRLKSGKQPPWFQDILDTAMDAKDRGSILELGSGTGELSTALSLCEFEVTLLDFSETSLNFSKELFAKIGSTRFVPHFYKADVTKTLPFADDSFDMVFSSGLLEHFDPNEQDHIIREAFRVSKSSILTLVPNAGSLPYRLGKWLQERDGTWKWGREDPFFTLEDIYKNVGILDFCEWTTAPYHALRFLEGARRVGMADVIRQLYEEIEKDQYQNLGDLEQGYLLVSVAYKHI